MCLFCKSKCAFIFVSIFNECHVFGTMFQVCQDIFCIVCSFSLTTLTTLELSRVLEGPFLGDIFLCFSGV